MHLLYHKTVSNALYKVYIVLLAFTIYAAQKSQNNSALTINYWLEDGTLINSQTFDYYRVSAGGIPVYTLGAIYAAQKSQNNSALTINYWLEDGTLINSQTFDYYRVSAGGIPVYTLGENYSINVPAGYTLITQAPDTVQVPALNRGVINLYVQPDGTNADGSAEALQAALNGTTYLGEQVSESIANALGRPELSGQTPLAGSSLSSPAGQTSASSQPSSSASSSASRSSSSQKSPDTGIALGTGGYIFSGSMGAIALSGLLLKNRRKGRNPGVLPGSARG